MITSRRKKRSAVPAETAQPAQPAWRQPPPKRRTQVRRTQAAVQRVDALPDKATRPVFQWLKTLLTAPKNPRAVGRRLGVGLVIIALIVGFARLSQSSPFTVSAAATQIRGCQRVPAEAVYAASALDQRNLFYIHPAAAAARIDALPGVAAASVHLRLPDQVIIDVREYAPLVAWQAVTTTVWLADDGTPLPMVGDSPPLSLVDVNGAAVAPDGRLRPQVLTNLKALHAARPDLVAVYYGALEGLYFRAPGGWTVYLGDGAPMDPKLGLLAATERDIVAHSRRVDVIDMRFDGHALLR
ncbi:MAG: hypothetical protein CVU38_02110 [Chloroflexi bacterium HGW-Chloroflexi-1]|nr:MAG: hypothetical protein CVU38_02110 [Chloroflexi bacterium HGW-Chloroflexi-1]